MEDWSAGSVFRKLIINNNNYVGTRAATLVGNPGDTTFNFDKIILEKMGHLELVNFTFNISYC
jgi:hypothetical protein